MRLGQAITRLMQEGDSMQKNIVLTKMLANKMVVYLNMLGALMEDIVVSNLKSTGTVVI